VRQRILVIEDEEAISLAVRDELEFEGFDVDLIEDGTAGLQAILDDPPDLIVLDLMLPGTSGFEICQEVRRRDLTTPIVILTARAQEVDRVRGLDLGADDYLVKPFSLAELLARIRAVLRRVAVSDPGIGSPLCLEIAGLNLDPTRHRVLKHHREVKLTPKEFKLLELMLRNPGVVISRDEFLDQVWGAEVFVTHRTVDTHISALRKKIEDNPEEPSYILSVRGIGYKFNEDLTEP
jgi:DNA-binding response OmpR family regulator